MREIVESFVVETQDILDGLHEDLLELEKSVDAALIDRVFRAVHTVKGTSSFLGLEQLNTLAHYFEDVLNRLRRNEIAFHPEMMDVLFTSFERMTDLLQQVLDRDIAPLPLEELYGDLAALCVPAPGGDGAGGEPALAHRVAEGGTKQAAGAQPGRTYPRSGSMRVDVERLERLLALAGEVIASGSAVSRIAAEMAAEYGDLPQLKGLHDHTRRLERLAAEIHSLARTTRVVEAQRLFSKFSRVARDLGLSLNKDIRIACAGSDTRIERSQADEIGEALLHLIRNAVDHGIEPRDVRRTRGKPEEGTISLRAERTTDRIVITVADDGRGLNPEVIRRRASALGFLSHEEAASLPDSRLYELIWEPGFTTTDVANTVSGRGVGMDVVRTMATRAGGSVEVCSAFGRGLAITLSLPSVEPHSTSP